MSTCIALARRARGPLLRGPNALHPALHSRAYASRPTIADRRRRVKDTSIEKLTAKWQPHWDQLAPQWHTLRTSDKGKAYVLPMFPYPSGTLHLGHLRVYTISDVLSRFKHMQGYSVLHPIGWDAFGLPAENAAIERGVHPEKWTLQNIEAMKAQMKEMGGHWNWDAELRTCSPDFYKHTQSIFLKLHERGLAYQAESLVNYDPVDKTVLANEQVDANGCSWRSGAKVEKLMLKQWFLKIKEFQEPLLRDLDALAKDGRWPEKVLAMQRNWIGKSEGTKLWFDIESANAHFEPVDVFTTRADTLFGVQYIALSLTHPIVKHLATTDEALRSFIAHAKDLPPDTKEGYLLPQVVARNPVGDVTGASNSSVPIYVAPYVLDDYGSGAVMGVPGHDTRDHAFWRENASDQPIKVVVSSKSDGVPSPLIAGTEQDKPMTEIGFVAADIPRFGGMPSEKAVGHITELLREAGKQAEKTVNWRLRDWLISRQRYWGTPIPIVHCNSCGPVPVPEADLPVELPNLPDSFFQGRSGNPLDEDENWKKTSCPKCGSPAERETDTMDTFMDSSWYFFRFLDANNNDALIDPQKANEGMQVDLYVGGVEHAILHLLYARFISKFLASTPTWTEGSAVQGEPFKRLITQGMVHGETFTDPENGRFLRPDEVDTSNRSKPIIKASGLTPNVSFEKMSKSKYNGVDPGATIAKYGADATRAHMLFQAPVSDVLEWDGKKITGVQRWLQRVLKLSSAFWFPDKGIEQFEIPQNLDESVDSIISRRYPEVSSTETRLASLKPDEAKLWTKTQQIIASVTDSYAHTYSLNTIISDLMTLTNTIWDTPHTSALTPWLKWSATAHLVRMLAPIAPGVAEESWAILHECFTTKHPNPRPDGAPSVFAYGFPSADTAVIPLINPMQTCVVQVDGRRKFEVEIPKCPRGVKEYEEKKQWVVWQVSETEAGKEWLDKSRGRLWAGTEGKAHPAYAEVPEGWNVVIVKDGKLVNFVAPGSKKKAKKEQTQ
jgi:leucyl-tRNA synthetase